MTTSYSYDVLADGKRRCIQWFSGGVVCTVIVGATVVMLMKQETPTVLHPADAKAAVAMTTASATPPAIATSMPASATTPVGNLHPPDAESAGAQVAPLAVLVAGTGSNKTVPGGQSFPEARVPQGSGGSGAVALPSPPSVHPADAKAGRNIGGSGVYEAEPEKPVAVVKDVPHQPSSPSVAGLVGVPADGYALIQVGNSIRPYAVGSTLPSGETLARADSKTGLVETRR